MVFLYKDLEDQVVNIYDSIEKAEEVMNLLECNRAEITEDIPAAALARSTEKNKDKKYQNKIILNELTIKK